MNREIVLKLCAALFGTAAALVSATVPASSGESPQDVDYAVYPPAPRGQPQEEADAKSAG